MIMNYSNNEPQCVSESCLTSLMIQANLDSIELEKGFIFNITTHISFELFKIRSLLYYKSLSLHVSLDSIKEGKWHENFCNIHNQNALRYNMIVDCSKKSEKFSVSAFQQNTKKKPLSRNVNFVSVNITGIHIDT